MFKVEMMLTKARGYETRGYANSIEEANAMVEELKALYNPIDVCYTVAE